MRKYEVMFQMRTTNDRNKCGGWATACSDSCHFCMNRRRAEITDGVTGFR